MRRSIAIATAMKRLNAIQWSGVPMTALGNGTARVDGVQIGKLDSRNGLGPVPNEFLEGCKVVLFQFVVFLRVLRLVHLRELWLGEAACYPAAVRPLVRQEEFRGVEDVVRRKQFVEVWFREIERVMRLEPCPQLRRD